MARRLKPEGRVRSTLSRLYDGKVAALQYGGTAGGLVGWASSVSGVSGLAMAACGAGVALFVGTIASLLTTRPTPISQIAVDAVGLDGLCHHKFCTEVSLRQACDMTRPHYGTDYVQFEIAEQWRKANREAFVEISNEKNEMCSCFGILALRQSCFDEFIRGRIADSQFTYDDICPPAETKKASRLYLSGVIVKDPRSHAGNKRASMMVWCILDHYRHYFGFRRKRDIYALAVSNEGERMLQNLHFGLCSPSATRLDGHNLYKLEMTKEVWQKLSQGPDWSRACVSSEVSTPPMPNN
jgi:hypothetical protein